MARIHQADRADQQQNTSRIGTEFGMLTLLHGLMWAPALVAGCISEPKQSEQTKPTNPVGPDQDYFSLTTTCGFLIHHSVVT